MMNKQIKKRISSTGIGLILILIAMFFLPGIFLNTEGSGSGEFQFYRGPVLPMTSLYGAEGIDVQRNVNFDFSPYEQDKDYLHVGKGAAGITDTYILTNTTTEAKTVELVYSFQAQFIDHPEEFPTIQVDGNTISPKLYPSVDTEELVRNAYNFERYSQVLTENDFLSAALHQPEKLDIPVTAYHFTDLAHDGSEAASYPMLVLRYALEENTTVWTMAADVLGTDDDGKQRLMFRVDRGEAWVFTQGGTLTDPEYGGNKGYNLSEASALENVTFRLEAYETTLGDVIQKMAHNYDFWAIEGLDSYPNPGHVTPEILAEGAVKRIHVMGYLEPSDRTRVIESLFYDVITEPRMMYFVFPVEVGIGQSVTVEASFIQEPSHDLSGPKHYREGYDMATKLGSDLHFTGLTASLSNTSPIELGKQNFGFDLVNGITEVTLDLQVDRYYLEVKIKK